MCYEKVRVKNLILSYCFHSLLRNAHNKALTVISKAGVHELVSLELGCLSVIAVVSQFLFVVQHAFRKSLSL